MAKEKSKSIIPEYRPDGRLRIYSSDDFGWSNNPCNDCKAWTAKGTQYFRCAKEGHCPALEKNRSDGEKLLARKGLSGRKDIRRNK